MIDMGADPKIQNGLALVLVASRSYEKTLFFIEECGINVNTHNSDALSEAMATSQIRIIKLLLEKGSYVPDIFWHNLLEEDANVETNSILQVLIDHGYDPEKAFGKILRVIRDQQFVDILKYFSKIGCNLNYVIDTYPN